MTLSVVLTKNKMTRFKPCHFLTFNCRH